MRRIIFAPAKAREFSSRARMNRARSLSIAARSSSDGKRLAGYASPEEAARQNSRKRRWNPDQTFSACMKIQSR